MPVKNLKTKIHFIGIGGIGVSALAKYYLAKGYKVSGSDLTDSEIIKSLRKKGAKIYIGKHKEKNLKKEVDLVIFSPAVGQNNPEFKKAKKLKIKLQSYPQALGDLTKEYFTVAVSGTHGKSTTTCLAGLLLTRAGLDPTVIAGTKMKEFENSNCRVGRSQYLIIEADEHFASFLNYWPKIVILTSIEADHLDYYKNLGNILRTFKKYLAHLPKEGLIIANEDDKNIYQITKNKKQTKRYFSLKQKGAKKLKKILRVPGEHNISNALGALTLARALRIPDKISFKALAEYKSSWRRFEIIKTKVAKKFITLISDYGHHPTEIRATLKAAREKYPKKKIWCVFQPHQYQRTFYLFEDFVKALKSAPADKIIITDIYDVAGREEKAIKKKVNSKKLAEKTKKENVIYLPKEKVLNFLEKNLKGNEVVIIMGAGNIYDLTIHLTEKAIKKKI